MKRAVFALALLVVGCKSGVHDGFAVDLTVVFDGSVTNEEIASMTRIHFAVSNAEQFVTDINPAGKFNGRSSAIRYKPGATTKGTLTFAMTAFDGTQQFAFGTVDVSLQAGATQFATLTLSGSGVSTDMSGSQGDMPSLDGAGMPPDLGSLPPPRQLAPMSTSRVTSRRPTLSWSLPAAIDGAAIDLCSDRACSKVIASATVTGTIYKPTMDLPTGAVFWRLRGSSGGMVGSSYSYTWELFVPAVSTATDTSYGTVLDVNGDGFADVLVGDWQNNVAYLYHGGASGVSPTPTPAMLPGPVANGGFGIAVGSAGDVNGDGFGDAVVADTNGTPAAVYVLLGSAQGVSASARVTITSPAAAGTGGTFGEAVAGVGDFNGDGFGDLLVGNPNGSKAGAVLFFGGGTPFAMTPQMFNLASNSGVGWSVASAGDVNADGFADLFVGVHSGAGSANGSAWVFTGGPVGNSYKLSAPSASGDFGEVVALAGDVNGDGYSDLLVGDYPNSYTGHAWIFHGTQSGPSAAPATTLSAPNTTTINFGSLLAGAGDLNHDGYSDILVGPQSASTAQSKAYVYLGGAGGIPSGATATAVYSAVNSWYVAAMGGDVNGDGFDDVVCGDYGAIQVMVFPGSTTPLSVTPARTLSSPFSSGAFGQAVW